jgi:hypothetical protein
VRGKDAAVRLAARREHAAPVIAARKPWPEAQLARIPQQSRLAEDIRSTPGHRPGLIRFLDDGSLELDTNPVENRIRPIALTRKTARLAGNEIGAENRAMPASLVATGKMSGVNPVDPLPAPLRAILDGHPQGGIEDLMPWPHAQPSSRAAWGRRVALAVRADKGYVGAEREAAFTEEGKVWGVMRKAPKGGSFAPGTRRVTGSSRWGEPAGSTRSASSSGSSAT